jgi:small subunit ribosomal protein S17
MEKTAVVLVPRYVKNVKYKKYKKISKKHKAHNENNEYKKGEKVLIEECRPISKDKHFRIIKKI